MSSVILYVFNLCVFCFSISVNDSKKPVTVWIVGDNHVVNSEKLAQTRPGGTSLGLDLFDISVCFIGRMGATVDDLDELIEEGKHKYNSPDIVIIHIGIHNFIYSPVGNVNKNLIKAIHICKQMLPTSTLFFSEICPIQNMTLEDRKFTKKDKGDKTLRRVNEILENVLHTQGCQIIKHYYLRPSIPNNFMYADCLHLSDMGYGMMLETFVNSVKQLDVIKAKVCDKSL